MRIGNFLCFPELIFAIRTDCFFCRKLIFTIFRKYPVPSIDNIFVFIEYVQWKYILTYSLVEILLGES